MNDILNSFYCFSQQFQKYQQFNTTHMENSKIFVLPFLTLLMLIYVSKAIVAPFDYSTSVLIMQNKTPTLFLLTSLAPEKPASKSNHLYQFHKAADIYYTLHPHKSPQNTQVAEEKLLFVVSDPNDGLYTFDRLAEYLGIEKKDTPVIVYLSHTHQKYRLQKGIEITSQVVLGFLQDISSGKQPVFYKSEPEESIEKNKSKYVKKLVGGNFNQVILSSEKECLVLFYTPLDYKSRVVKVQFEKTAQSLQNNKNILFYKVDSTKNEVLISGSSQHPQLLIKQQGTPLILLFPKNKQNPPIKYSTLQQYELSNDYMLKWLKQRTEYQWVRSVDVSEEFFEDL